jgi:hypothetical protein
MYPPAVAEGGWTFRVRVKVRVTSRVRSSVFKRNLQCHAVRKVATREE